MTDPLDAPALLREWAARYMENGPIWQAHMALAEEFERLKRSEALWLSGRSKEPLTPQECGSRGGKARAAALSPERRREIARHAAKVKAAQRKCLAV